MLPAVFDRLSSEWRLIRRAPLAFAASIALVTVVVLFAVWSHFATELRRLRILVKLQDQQIASMPRKPQETPRRLTSREKDFLVRVLSRAPNPAVVYLIEPAGDPEAIACMRDLVDVLSRAGWKAHTDNPNLVPDIGASFWRSMPGFVLFVKDQAQTPGAKFLAEAMTVAGFAVRWGGDPRLPPNTCELLLGAVPHRAPASSGALYEAPDSPRPLPQLPAAGASRESSREQRERG
jgi:hypothetical protein